MTTALIHGYYKIDLPENSFADHLAPILRWDVGNDVDYLNTDARRREVFDANRITVGLNVGFGKKLIRSEIRFNYESTCRAGNRRILLVTSCCTTSLRSRSLRRFSCGERIWGDRFPCDSRRIRFRLRKSVGRDAFGRRISVRLRSGAGERWDRKAGRRPCFCLGGAVPVRLRASASCVGVVVGLESSG